MESINALFTSLAQSFTQIALSVALFFLIVGAVIYMTAAGSTRQKETGKTAMIDALLGLAIVLGAKAILGLVTSALGSGA